MLYLNWYIWLDNFFRPAWSYESGHTINTDGWPTDTFKSGEKIGVVAKATVHRLCEKTFTRIIIFPDNSKRIYNRTAAAHNTLGTATVKYFLDQNVLVKDGFKPGKYRLIVESKNDCNPPWPPQYHKGSDLIFYIEE